jgi:ABC-2 type transport system permease protein
MAGIMIARLLNNIVVTGLLLAAALLTSGQSLALPWGKVALLMVIVSLQGYAIGWVMAGLALNFKRIQSVYTLLQFAFVAALAVPWELHPLIRLIPLSWPYHLMQKVLGAEVGASPWSLEVLGCLLLSIGYLGLGWGVFNQSLRWARQLGHLGHY